MKILYPFVAIALTTFGCTHNNPQETRFHSDGRAKPRIAILDLLDNSEARMPWSLTNEFTDEISIKLNSGGRLFIQSIDDLPIPLPVLEGKQSPFQDHSWLIGENSDAEFYVFLELVEHSLEPRQQYHEHPSYDLIMSVRIKIVDVRKKMPRVILQEFIEQTNYIPAQLANLDYHKFGYGRATFPLSPVGHAHSKLTKRIAARIQDYVLLAKSRS